MAGRNSEGSSPRPGRGQLQSKELGQGLQAFNKERKDNMLMGGLIITGRKREGGYEKMGPFGISVQVERSASISTIWQEGPNNPRIHTPWSEKTDPFRKEKNLQTYGYWFFGVDTNETA